MTNEEQRDELVGMVALAIAGGLGGVDNLNTISEENDLKFHRSARAVTKIVGEACRSEIAQRSKNIDVNYPVKNYDEKRRMGLLRGYDDAEVVVKSLTQGKDT